MPEDAETAEGTVSHGETEQRRRNGGGHLHEGVGESGREAAWLARPNQIARTNDESLRLFVRPIRLTVAVAPERAKPLISVQPPFLCSSV